MPRCKISEYRAKKILSDNYDGFSINLESIDEDIRVLDDTETYVVKVDQGIKKRGKNGLIALNVTKEGARLAVDALASKGFSRFIAERMVPHELEEERYLCLERTREGISIAFSMTGGIDVEEHSENIKRYDSVEDVPLPDGYLPNLIEKMNQEHISFLEINPLIVRDNTVIMLDAAAMVDTAGGHLARWCDKDIVDPRTLDSTEKAVAVLNDNSPASFSLRILNHDGALWLLLSGGGASITIADEAHNHGRASLIGNYGEYSGGPSTEETYLYTREVLKQMRKSKAKKKALIIAGGVANFTDVKKTFAGVIQALKEDIEASGPLGAHVFVRRGGPNEKEGLKLMGNFLGANGIFGSIHGSDIVLTDVVKEALDYVDA